MPAISDLFFKTAILFLVIGIGVGLQMGIGGIHNVIGAHAHTNLLGWATSALFGTYYALNPAKATGRLPVAHYGVYTLGVVMMITGLYFEPLGATALGPLIPVGSLITFLGVLIFAYVVFVAAARATDASPAQ